MKWLKRLGILLLVIIGILAILFFVYNESKPESRKGAEAEALANKMLAAIDKTAWDSTTYIQWTFKGMHSFLWDKDRHFVKVSWGEQEVLLDTKKVDGKAFVKGVEQTGNEAKKMIYDAWGFFCNDSFWLNAPAKAFDPGTERSIVTQEDGTEALMVSYSSGGVTPGDAYLWILDENGLPKSWKMWGKDYSCRWNGGLLGIKWETLTTGAKIATFHTSSALDLDISNLKAGVDLAAMGISADPFEVLQ